MASITGPGIFRSAVAIEILANLGSLPMLFLNPEKALLYLVKSPLQITSATKTMVQLFGAVTLGITVPLILSFPNPTSGKEAERQIATRRTTYIMMGSTEAAFVGCLIYLYSSSNDAGLTKAALGTMIGVMEFLTATRLFFLYWKPEWMEGQQTNTKTRAE